MRLAIVAALLTVALAPVARADSIDIPSAAHLTIVGSSPGIGEAVAGAGDVNGDGIPDVIVVVGDPERFRTDDPAAGAYVVFGRRTPGTVNLDSLGRDGFKIDGHVNGGISSAVGVGDVNGDGLADVVVIEPYIDFQGRLGAGSATVVFGKRTTDTVDLNALGSHGFQIGGPRASDVNRNDMPFVSADAAGDVNGDGRADVIVGFGQALCVGFMPSCDDIAGSAYVVYGKRTSGAVDTAALGPAGFSITGDRAGASVAGLGDVNGDGIPDFAVSRHFDNAGWVVFGRRPPADVDLSALGSNGFKIVDTTTGSPGGSVAWSLAGLGDVNGDGRPDVLVGVGFNSNLRDGGPRAAVIFGGPSTAPVDIAALGDRGFEITGGDAVGLAAAAGDVNRDGRGDVLVNGYRYDTSKPDLGVGLVFGKASTDPVDVNALGPQGVTLTGAFSNTGVVRSFAGAGDMTGDGAADVVIGAPTRYPDGPPGRAYVVSLRPSPFRRLDELRFRIASFGLDPQVRDRLLRRVDRIQQALDHGRLPRTCRRLDRLIQLAIRLNGGDLSAAQTFTIVAGADAVKSAAGCR